MSRMLPQNNVSVHRCAALVWEVTRRYSTYQVYIEVQRRIKIQSRVQRGIVGVVACPLTNVERGHLRDIV
jgi:hypothetical protein